MIIGAHTSIAGGLHLALHRARELGAETLAIFSKNQRQWRVPPLEAPALAAWREGLAHAGFDPERILCHDSYLINLAHPEREPWERAVAAFGDEVDRCDALGVGHLVFHPGAHLGGLAVEAACDRVAAALRRVLEARPESRVRLCVENTAGQGTSLGARFEELARILEGAQAPARLALCFDTCHAFAAGYDLSTAAGCDAVFSELHRTVGLHRLACFHLNDALKPCGSRVDRHANLGQGALGEAPFRWLVNDPRFAAHPGVVETPVETHGGHAGDLRRLASWREAGAPPGRSTDTGDIRARGRYRPPESPTETEPTPPPSSPPRTRATQKGARTMDRPTLQTALLELIRRASTDLPPDVENALKLARRREAAGTGAQGAMEAILENIALARAQSTPICQDTGTNLYFVDAPVTLPEATLRAAILGATRQATKKGYLRPNVVDPVTGKNTGDNVGLENPQIHWHQHGKKSLRVDLMLKGGGCENVSIQYTLPDKAIGAGRDLEGVYRCIVDSAHRAQGKGCAPGIFGVGVGGDRLSSYHVAKEQLRRALTDTNTDDTLAKLERRCLVAINKLGIGPMGFGGRTTALAVKIGTAHRLPASYFVSIAYMCWACRRWTMELSPKGKLTISAADGARA